MKKSLTALIALTLAFVFGTATLAYAEAPAAKTEGAAADVHKDEMKAEKKEVKKHKKLKKKAAKKAKRGEKKEEMKEGAPAK